MNALTLSEGALNGFLLGGLYAVTALGLFMVFNVNRIVNLAHGELLILGAYISFIVSNFLGIDPLRSVLITIVLLFLVGYFLQAWLLNPLMDRGPEPTLVTALGLSIIAQGLYMISWGGNSRVINSGYSQALIKLVGVDVPLMYIISFGLSIVLIGGIYLFLMNTFIGKAMRAVAQDNKTAMTRGINVKSIYSLTCALGASTAALGGVLIGMTFSFYPSGGLPWFLKGFIIILLGGGRNITWILAAGLILGVAEGFGTIIIGEGYRDLIGLFIFMVILIFKPARLFGSVRSE
jgi:branched-chain amino acid transport system permease protein